MIKASEIIAQDAVNFDYPSNLDGRVFFRGKPTECMRVMTYTRSGQHVCNFGIDIIAEYDIVLTPHRYKWNANIMKLLKDLAKEGDFGIGYLIYVEDDSNGNATEINESNSMFEGIEEIKFDV